ncbi:MAG: hypothetical protein LUH22_13280 [Bacteroides sp.]|nr:hypothetical protein [Bacteroides sp.]
MDVLILNRTDSTIYLPACLDGSSLKLRYPAANIEILNGRKRTVRFCPMFNPLVSRQIRKLEPNECFNPIDAYTVEIKSYPADSILCRVDQERVSIEKFWTPKGLDLENYLLPGKYELQFTYNTKRDSGVLSGWNIVPDWSDVNLDFFDRIPEVEIKSNIVTLTYKIF